MHTQTHVRKQYSQSKKTYMAENQDCGHYDQYKESRTLARDRIMKGHCIIILKSLGFRIASGNVYMFECYFLKLSRLKVFNFLIKT